MSAIMNFAIFPIDKGSSVGEYVSKVVAMIKESGLPYEFTPMSTIVEAESIKELTAVINSAFEIMAPFSDRMYCTVSLDYSSQKMDRIKGKRTSIVKRIGEV